MLDSTSMSLLRLSGPKLHLWDSLSRNPGLSRQCSNLCRLKARLWITLILRKKRLDRRSSRVCFRLLTILPAQPTIDLLRKPDLKLEPKGLSRHTMSTSRVEWRPSIMPNLQMLTRGMLPETCRKPTRRILVKMVSSWPPETEWQMCSLLREEPLKYLTKTQAPFDPVRPPE